ncbi:MAG: hypothetical protein KY457_12365 [Actinobacteria bacterium]|nr:hypothetical protein [Actinomycetota bacterium]
MIKRIFTLFFGLGVGLLVGAFVVKRIDDATRAVAPANLAHRAGRSVGGLSGAFRRAVDEGKRAAAAREAELRAEFNVPTARDLAARRSPGTR